MDIIQLDQTWKGRKIPFHYVSAYHYAAKVVASPQGWQLSFERVPFDTPREINFTDELLEDYLEAPQLIGAFEGEHQRRDPCSGGGTGTIAFASAIFG